MCGIAISIGSNSEKIVLSSLKYLIHRGRDDQRIVNFSQKLTVGYNRLAINDQSENAMQPFIYKNWIWVVNGEIYNYRTLKRITNFEYKSNSDIECILPLFLKFGIDFIHLLDGMFAGVIIDLDKKLLYCFRDCWGIKPLYKIATPDGIIFISELKSYKNDIILHESISPGLTIYNFSGDMLASISIKRRNFQKYKGLKFYIERSVLMRIPPKNIKTGVLLSGGIDSSIISYLSLKHRKDLYFITVGLKDSEDIQYAKLFVDYFQLNDRHIVYELDENDMLKALRPTIYHLEKFNPSNVSNGLVTYFACKKASELGIKVLLCGEGADELFAGYRSFRNTESFFEDRKNLIENLKDTELHRLDRMSMAFHIEARVPFLESRIHQFSDILSRSELIETSEKTTFTKMILRKIFKDEIPQEILYRPKTPFDIGSGGRKILELIPDCASENFCDYNGNPSNEMKYYYKIWKELFPNLSNPKTDFKNFGDYPVFMKFIEKRGVTQK